MSTEVLGEGMTLTIQCSAAEGLAGHSGGSYWGQSAVPYLFITHGWLTEVVGVIYLHTFSAQCGLTPHKLHAYGLESYRHYFQK